MVRSAVNPTNAAPAIRTDMSTTVVRPCPRVMKVAAVAQPSAARTKNCQACSPWSLPVAVSADVAAAVLVEISELIVETLFHVGIAGRCRGVRGIRPSRPARRRKAHEHDAGAADE